VLTKVEDSMLGRMFGRCDAMLQPVDGCISIDRDSSNFGMILDFMHHVDGPRTPWPRSRRWRRSWTTLAS